MKGTIASRLDEHTDKTETCWLWTGYLNPSNGYGRVQFDGKRYVVHRLSYERHVGPVPEGMQLDHLCRVRHCLNPAHLEPVTVSVNTARSAKGWSLTGRCLSGEHDATDEANVYQSPDGKRSCRPCRTQRSRESRALRARGGQGAGQ